MNRNVSEQAIEHRDVFIFITFNSSEYEYITDKRLNKKRDHNYDLRKSKSVLESASIV